MLELSRKSVRSSRAAYAGAFTALTFGITLIALTVTLIASVDTTLGRTDAGEAERVQLDGLSSMFGFMSGVSLFMALFVVGSTFGFVVATRQRELGLLRLVGATPRQVRRLLLGEASVVALAATVVGCLIATVLGPVALWAVRAVGATSLHLVAPSPWLSWVIAAPCGVLVALAGCWRSSKRAAKVPPTAALREAAIERRRPGVVAIGMGVLTLGTVVAAIVLAGRMAPIAALLVAILMPMVIVIGLTGLGPMITPRLAGLVALPFARRFVTARLAADEVRAAVRTTSSVAAPVMAISAVAGSLILTMSFTSDWTSALNRAQLAAPVVVTDPASASRLADDPAVGMVDARRTLPLRIQDTTEEVDVVDVSSAMTTRRLMALRGSLEDLHGRAVAVSESWTFDSGVGLGGHLAARLDGQRMQLTVVAVVPDASDLYGDLMVPSDLPGASAAEPSTLFLMPRPGVTDQQLLAAARGVAGDSALPAGQWVDDLAASERRMNNIALLVLLGPAGLYAGIAIVNATLIGAAQRGRQRRLVGLLGATPAQVRRTALWQAALTTGAGLLLGATTTVFLGWLVRQAIARDLAGHAVGMTIPWVPLTSVAALCAGLALVAALAASRAPRT
jgi:putative ABC transport system permease protein